MCRRFESSRGRQDHRSSVSAGRQELLDGLPRQGGAPHTARAGDSIQPSQRFRRQPERDMRGTLPASREWQATTDPVYLVHQVRDIFRSEPVPSDGDHFFDAQVNVQN